MAAKVQSLSVDLPRIDAGTQSRLAINEDAVAEYAEIIAASNGEWPFPPLDVFHDGTDHFVGDGFHRFLAAHRAKRGTFPCKIHAGTAMDARIFGMTANDKHGLRMTRADKRACVEWLLDNGGKLTQTEVAEKAGVSRRTVAQIVADRKPETAQTPSHSGGENVQTSHCSGGGDAPPPKRDGQAQNAPDTPKSRESSNKAATEKKEDEPAAPPKDAKGRTIPPALREAWEKAAQFDAWSRQLTGIVREIKEFLENDKQMGAWFDHLTLGRDIANCKHALKFAKPYVVCPTCKGKGCGDCREAGWLPQTSLTRNAPAQEDAA